jgi:hypothetical protein
MILVYAEGGGLGHLTRVRALVHTLGLREPVTVVSSSPAGMDPRVSDGVEVVAMPFRRDDVAARRAWLARTLAEREPTSIVVDAFPAGLGGELDAAVVGSVPCDHVARLLRWPAYRRVVPANPVRFRTTYVLEDLDPGHAAHLEATSGRLVPLSLADPPPAKGLPPWPGASSGGPRWLIAHSGPAAEVEELVAYARDLADVEGVAPELVVASPAAVAPRAAPDLVTIDRYPVWPLFESADRVITAAGFNVMRQLADHEHHVVVPMPRRFDDQFERARRLRVRASARAGADR